jgi:hypothetical protein
MNIFFFDTDFNRKVLKDKMEIVFFSLLVEETLSYYKVFLFLSVSMDTLISKPEFCDIKYFSGFESTSEKKIIKKTSY